MPRIAFAAALLLGGCTAQAASTAPADPAPSIPVRGETPGYVCQLEGTKQFIGKPANDKTKAAILRVSTAAVLRWAPPGTMLTMDFRSDRVTVYLGPDRKITKISCG